MATAPRVPATAAAGCAGRARASRADPDTGEPR